MSQGFKEGINTAINSAIDLGKSALGIVTGDFENISQVQAAVQKGGIIDGISDTIDFVLEKTENAGILPTTITRTIRTGKNTLLNNVSNNIENEFNKQLECADRLQKFQMVKQFYNYTIRNINLGDEYRIVIKSRNVGSTINFQQSSEEPNARVLKK